MRSDAIPVGQVLAKVEGGIGTRRQWLDAGATTRMFADGRLVRVARGLYVTAGDPMPTARRLAGLLPEGAVLGGWAAAGVHGFRDAGPTMDSDQGAPLLAYLARSDHRRPPGFATRRTDLLKDESCVAEGILVTAPARTAYDMARFSTGIRAATGILDAALWPGGVRPVSPAGLDAVAEAHPYGKGNPLFRAARALANGRARSFPESSLRVRLVREAGVVRGELLANPTVQIGGIEYELDLVDLSSGLVLEYDGAHHANGAQRSRDARKDDAIDDAGLLRVRCTSVELGYETQRFVGWVHRRRSAALEKGSRERVAAMTSSGMLVERPLRLYP